MQARAARAVARGARRGFATAPGAKPPVVPSSGAKPVSGSAAVSAGKPAPAQLGMGAPGAAADKQGAGRAGVLIPLLAVAGAAGAYFAYQEGYIPKDLYGLLPKQESKDVTAARAGAAMKPPTAAAPIQRTPSKEVAAAAPQKVEAKVEAPPAPKTTAAAVPAAAVPVAAATAAAAPAEPSKPSTVATPTAPAADEVASAHQLKWAAELARRLAEDEARAAAAPAAPEPQREAPAATGSAEAAPAPSAAAEPTAAPAAVALPAPQPDALQIAKESVASWKVAQVTGILQREAAGTSAGEVEVMGPGELREKVLKLSAELQNRSRWEAMHLLELLEKNDAKWESLVRAAAAAAAGAAAAWPLMLSACIHACLHDDGGNMHAWAR